MAEKKKFDIFALEKKIYEHMIDADIEKMDSIKLISFLSIYEFFNLLCLYDNFKKLKLVDIDLDEVLPFEKDGNKFTLPSFNVTLKKGESMK